MVGGGVGVGVTAGWGSVAVDNLGVGWDIRAVIVHVDVVVAGGMGGY